jgi:hypothetical protein
MPDQKETSFDFHCSDITGYRPLCDTEREILIKNGNSAQSWDLIRVHEYFNPQFVSQCRFFGEVYIGALKEGFVEHEGFSLPIGIYNSTIMNCSIGHFSAINLLHYCSNCDIGSQVLIHNTGEIRCDKFARFGNGCVLPGDFSEEYRWLYLVNENGGRKVLPFCSMNCSDAYIWVKNPHDELLIERLKEITNRTCQDKTGCRGIIDHEAVVKNVKSLTNSMIKNSAVIEDAEKIDNSTILSDDLESTLIGSGVIITDSIIGYGNRIQSGAQLHSVITGGGVSISQVSRISHSFIGDNSAIACCEIANSFIFPSHGQHHNNSFLIAAMIGGQSNIAAGATVGSNHNSRMNDGEIWASRGFWPGLCTSFKHNSRFASYTMCVKGDYPAELDIPFPFSLIINDPSKNTLLVIPAYWLSHNMYSLMRSRYKFPKRDKRIHANQIIEHDPFAPDTVEEILAAISMLEQNTGREWYRQNKIAGVSSLECEKKGRELLQSSSFCPDRIEMPPGTIEKGNRTVYIIKPLHAWKVYQDIICWYAVNTLLSCPESDKLNISELLSRPREKEWINFGGQILRKTDFQNIISKIKTTDEIKTWQDIHQLYTDYQNEYETLKFHHAAAVLSCFISPDKPLKTQYISLLKRGADISKWIVLQTRGSRSKDFTDRFRTMVYDSADELKSVLGMIDEDSTIETVEKESKELCQKLEKVINAQSD